jgi:gas vesicle protein
MKKLLAGLIGGISLGLLFAPDTGKQTRAKLAKSDNKIKDIVELFTLAGNDASGEVSDFINSTEIKSLIKKGSGGVDEILSKGKNLSQSGKNELASVFEKISKTLTENAEKISNSSKKFFSKK